MFVTKKSEFNQWDVTPPPPSLLSHVPPPPSNFPLSVFYAGAPVILKSNMLSHHFWAISRDIHTAQKLARQFCTLC